MTVRSKTWPLINIRKHTSGEAVCQLCEHNYEDTLQYSIKNFIYYSIYTSQGLMSLLDSRDAVTFLMEVLPRVAEAFDDPSINVRVAFIKLLLKIKATKFMR